MPTPSTIGIFSGRGTLLPVDIANCQVWWRADTGRTSPRVSSWTNQGALGGTGTAAAGPRPTLNPEGFAGRDSITWDDTDDRLTYSGAAADLVFLHNGTGATLFLVIDVTAAGLIFSTGASAFATVGYDIIQTAANLQTAISNGGVGWMALTTTAHALGTAAYVTHRNQLGAATESDVRINGTGVAAIPYTGAPNAAAANVAQIGNVSTGGAQAIGGDIAEIIIYNRYLTNAEVTEVEAYLATRYSL